MRSLATTHICQVLRHPYSSVALHPAGMHGSTENSSNEGQPAGWISVHEERVRNAHRQKDMMADVML